MRTPTVSTQGNAGRGAVGLSRGLRRRGKSILGRKHFERPSGKNVKWFSTISVWWELMTVYREGGIRMAKSEVVLCFLKKGPVHDSVKTFFLR